MGYRWPIRFSRWLRLPIAGYNDAIGRAAANGAQPNDLALTPVRGRQALKRLNWRHSGQARPEQHQYLHWLPATHLVVGKEASSAHGETGPIPTSRRTDAVFWFSGRQQARNNESGQRAASWGGLVRYRREMCWIRP